MGAMAIYDFKTCGSCIAMLNYQGVMGIRNHYWGLYWDLMRVNHFIWIQREYYGI